MQVTTLRHHFVRKAGRVDVLVAARWMFKCVRRASVCVCVCLYSILTTTPQKSTMKPAPPREREEDAWGCRVCGCVVWVCWRLNGIEWTRGVWLHRGKSTLCRLSGRCRTRCCLLLRQQRRRKNLFDLCLPACPHAAARAKCNDMFAPITFTARVKYIWIG